MKTQSFVRRIHIVFLALGCALAVPHGTRAHGDEQHGPAPSPSATHSSGGSEHVASAETELFTVVVKYPARGTDGRLPMRIYVADANRTEPVTGARVQLEVQGVGTVNGVASGPGIYTASLREPAPGTHADAVVTVEGSQVDLIPIAALHFGPVATEANADAHGQTAHTDSRTRTRTRTRTMAIVAGASLAVLLLLTSIAFAVRRRRARARLEAPEHTDASNEVVG